MSLARPPVVYATLTIACRAPGPAMRNGRRGGTRARHAPPAAPGPVAPR